MSNRLLDDLEGHWLNLILQTAERGQVRTRQEVGPSREQLPQLHECRPHGLEITGETLRIGFRT